MVYRAALIGCGRIGSEFDDHPRAEGIYSHARAYVACAQTELVAVCDLDRSKAERCATRENVSAVFDDYLQMLAETGPDIVSVCTPDATHFEVLSDVINTSGVKAILAEKPLALQVPQAREVVDAADHRGILLAANYTRRYSNAYRKLRNTLANSEIGKVQIVSGFYTRGILHNGTHWLDLARYLLGEIVAINGNGADVGAQIDPTVSGAIEFASGVRGYLHGCAFDHDMSLFEMDILGTRGRVSIKDSGQVIRFYGLSDSSQHAGFKTFAQTRTADGELACAMLNAVEDLVAALTGGTEPSCTGRDALAALQIAVALRDSARAGGRVSLI